MGPITERFARKIPTTLSWRFGVVILLLAAISLAVGTQAAIDTNRNTRCLADYSARQAEVSSARSAATAEKDNANAALLDPLVEVILDITKPRPEPASPVELGELRAAAKRYKAAARDLQTKRATNPLPEFPRECSEVNQ